MDRANPRETQTPAPGFRRVARQVSTFTTRLLLSGLVLVLGLGLGRQVLLWWRADPTGPARRESAESPGDASQGQQLRFGNDPLELGRRAIAGSRADALHALRDSCRALADAARPPDRPLSEPERRLLDDLAAKPPAEEDAGRWALYQLEEPLPMVVVVRPTGPKGGATVAGDGRRVVTWGLALPMASQAWSLYTFHQPSSWTEAAGLPAPPNAIRVLAMQTVEGGTTLAIRGPDSGGWKAFYDQWFASRGWTGAGWQSSGAAWSNRYSKGEGQRVDLQFASDPYGKASGLLVYTPARIKAGG